MVEAVIPPMLYKALYQEISEIWPTETTLYQKLHSDVKDLRRTTQFMITTSLNV